MGIVFIQTAGALTCLGRCPVSVCFMPGPGLCASASGFETSLGLVIGEVLELLAEEGARDRRHPCNVAHHFWGYSHLESNSLALDDSDNGGNLRLSFRSEGGDYTTPFQRAVASFL